MRELKLSRNYHANLQYWNWKHSGLPLLVELLKDVRRVLASLEKGPVDDCLGIPTGQKHVKAKIISNSNQRNLVIARMGYKQAFFSQCSWAIVHARPDIGFFFPLASLYNFEYEKENRRQRDSLRIGMLTIDSLFGSYTEMKDWQDWGSWNRSSQVMGCYRGCCQWSFFTFFLSQVRWMILQCPMRKVER